MHKPPVDRASSSFTTAQSIMGSDAPSPAKAASTHAANSAQGVHSIDVAPAANGGVTVSHSMKKSPKKGNEWDVSGPRETNVFSTPHEAHAHIGKLLGVHPPSSKSTGGLT